MDSADTVVAGDSGRYVLFPIRFPTLWERYKVCQRSFWTPEEIDMSADQAHWTHALDDGERQLLSVILAFFASSDGIVGENIVQQFYSEVQAPEARCFYGFQIMMENIHAETYALILQELITDETELQHLFGAIQTIPSVGAKAAWCLKWFDASSFSFATRLVAFAIVEGVFFSSSFAAIMWIRSRGLLPGFCQSNDLIMRDEGQHVAFACELYGVLTECVPEHTVCDMLREAVGLEQAFFRSALPRGLCSLNSALMDQYVEYIADFLLSCLGYLTMYGQINPFPFMEATAIPSRANFFERAVSEYLGAAVGVV